MNKQVVLGFSGGLDTSFCVEWLKEEGFDEVVCVTLDIGQEVDSSTVRSKAEKLGVKTIKVIDGKENFVHFFLMPALKANALYQNVYPLATALSRPYIGKVIADVAMEMGIRYVAHGCTGKGNDQVRIEMAIRSIMPDAEILGPVRDNNFSRDYEIEYLRSRNIDLSFTKENSYSIDQNLWGRSICAGILEDISVTPPEEVYEWTRSIDKCPEDAEEIEIEFASGVPVRLNNKMLRPSSIIEKLNEIGGTHGIGRIDHIEDRLVGIKSREIYEAPAALILIRAHQALEALTLSRSSLDFKRLVEDEYARLIYLGDWFSLHHMNLLAYLQNNQVVVDGVIRLKLHKGNCIVVGRRSDLALYQKTLATYGEESEFDQRAAAQFIKFLGMESSIQSKIQKLNFDKELHQLPAS